MVKDNNNVWHGSTDTYTTPAISLGTVVFGLVVNHSALDLYGIGSVVNNTDLVVNLVY